MEHGDVTLAFTVRGGGKSRVLKDLLARSRPRRVVVVDPMREYKGPGVLVTSYRDLATYLRRNRPICRVRWQVADTPWDLHFGELCEIVWAMRNVLLVVDELDLFMTARSVPESFRTLVEQGRHRGISVWGATRRTARIPADLSAQADVLYIGRMHEPADLDYWRKVIGRDNARALLQLRPYHFLVWTPDRPAFEINAKRNPVSPEPAPEPEAAEVES